jgi:hypothetical protein
VEGKKGRGKGGRWKFNVWMTPGDAYGSSKRTVVYKNRNKYK